MHSLAEPATRRALRSHLRETLMDTDSGDCNSQEPQIKMEDIKEEEPSILPSSEGLAKVVLEEFTFVPAEGEQEVRLLVKNHEFTRESYAPEDMGWRCINEHCQAKLLFIEEEAKFTDVHLEHNHPPPDLKSPNLKNACTMKLLTPIVRFEQCEYYGSETLLTLDHCL